MWVVGPERATVGLHFFGRGSGVVVGPERATAGTSSDGAGGGVHTIGGAAVGGSLLGVRV